MPKQWEDRMFDGGDVVGGMAKTLPRQLVVQWNIGIYNMISQEMG